MSHLSVETLRTFSFVSPAGSSGTYYSAGFYRTTAAAANLTNASTTITFGNVNVSYAAHAFAVFGGAGTVNTGVVGLRVTGTSIDDEGTRTAGDSAVITADITSVALNQYVEVKKFIGRITYELYVVSGAPTVYSVFFNYGFAKYDDFANRNFHLENFECVGRAGAADTGFNIELLHHKSTGWTYSLAAFVPGTTALCNMNTDHSTEKNLANGHDFAYKRTDLTTSVNGNDSEGVLVRITTGAARAVEMMNIIIGVHLHFT